MAAAENLVRIVIVDDGANSTYRRSPPLPPAAPAFSPPRTFDPTRTIPAPPSAPAPTARQSEPETAPPPLVQIPAPPNVTIPPVVVPPPPPAAPAAPVKVEVANPEPQVVRVEPPKMPAVPQPPAPAPAATPAPVAPEMPRPAAPEVRPLTPPAAQPDVAPAAARPETPEAPPLRRKTVETQTPDGRTVSNTVEIPRAMPVKPPRAMPVDAPPLQLPTPLAKSEGGTIAAKTEKENAAKAGQAAAKEAKADKAAKVEGLQTMAAAGMPGAGSAAAMMGAAGPAGIAIAALQAVKSAGDSVRADIEAVGAGMTKLAGNDMSVLGDATKGAGEALGKISPVAGEVVKTFGTVVTTLQSVTKAFVDRGKELSQYDAGLAVAGAQSEIRRIQADMREAQKLGPSLAKLTEQQSRSEEQLRELLLPIKKFLIEKLGWSLEVVTGFIDWLKPYVEGFFEVLKRLGEELKGVGGFLAAVSPAFAILANINDILEEFRRRARTPDLDPNALNAVWNRIFGFGGDVGPNDGQRGRNEDPWIHRVGPALSGEFGFGNVGDFGARDRFEQNLPPFLRGNGENLR